MSDKAGDYSTHHLDVTIKLPSSEHTTPRVLLCSPTRYSLTETQTGGDRGWCGSYSVCFATFVQNLSSAGRGCKVKGALQDNRARSWERPFSPISRWLEISQCTSLWFQEISSHNQDWIKKKETPVLGKCNFIFLRIKGDEKLVTFLFKKVASSLLH